MSLRDCLKKVGLSKQDSAVVRALVMNEKTPNRTAAESAKSAISKRLAELHSERDSINKQVNDHLSGNSQEEKIAEPASQKNEAEIAAAKVEEASKEAAHSPLNDKPLPTPAQHEAGNYAKGHVNVLGMDITIENPRGSVRSGIDPNGKEWHVKMTEPYGYIKRTVGGDKEHIDVYLGKHLTEDNPVFVIDQIDPSTKKFDEHKVVFGAKGYGEAKDIYDNHFSDDSGEVRRGAVTKMDLQSFQKWLKGDTTTALKYQEPKTTSKAAPERRADTTTRKSVSDMSADELRQALLTDHLTGINNRRAYEEAEKLPIQVSSDADSLKWINDNMGHESGDKMLKAIGEAFRSETDQAYHISGDEFVVQAHTPEEAQQIMDRVADRLSSAILQADSPSGDRITVKGIGVSHGKGTSLQEAEYGLQRNKQERQDAGLRSARGTEPPGTTRSGGNREGVEDIKNHPAAESNALEQPETKPPRALTREAANRLAKQFTDQGSPTQVIPHPTEQGKYALFSREKTIDEIRSNYPDAKLDIQERKDSINVSRIVIAPDDRNKGIGTRIMTDLIDHADKTGKTITLSPSNDFGGSIVRLKAFYKSFGFVENAGRNKDFTISESMYRLPRDIDTKFKRGEEGNGLKSSMLSVMAKNIKESFPHAADIEVLKSTHDAPEDLLSQIHDVDGHDTIKGAWYDGKVYLFADNMHSLKDAETTILHELGHDGMRKLFGKDLDPVLKSVYDGSVKVQLEVAKLRKQFPDLSITQAVEEHLADLAASKERPTYLGKVVSYIRDFLRQHGFLTKFSDNDILNIVESSRGALTGTQGDFSAAFSRSIKNELDAAKEAYGKAPTAKNLKILEDLKSKYAEIPKSEESDYRISHRAPQSEFGAPLHDLTKLYPDDIYSSKAAHYYGHFGHGDKMDEASIKMAQSFRDKPNANVKIYRAVPEGVTGINSGDWVTINKEYAKYHGESQFDGKYNIVEKTIKAKDIFTNGDSIHEWGYDPNHTAMFSRPTKALDTSLDEMKKISDIAYGKFRESLATIDRETGTVDASLKTLRDYFKSIPQEDRWKSMAEFQKGGVNAVKDANAREFYGTWSKAAEDRAQTMKDFDEGFLKETIPNYFSQMWKDPKSAMEWYQRMMGKGPLEGGKNFMKKRTYASYEEGMSWKVFTKDGDAKFFKTEEQARAAAGKDDMVKPPLEPISNNPTDIMQLSLQQMDKFIAMHQFRNYLDENGWIKTVRRGEQAPDGWARVEDPSFRTQRAVVINDKETGEANAAIIGFDYMAPALVAKDLNNYLSKGLEQHELWRNFRYAQNLMLSARLGLSAFHAGFTTMDTLVSHVDVGARYLLDGDVGSAVKMWGKAITSPLSAPLEGRRLLKQFYGQSAADPHTAAILDMITKGGARGKMNPTDFNNSINTFKQAWDSKDLKGTALHALPAMMEAIMSPIASHLVPWQKMTARVLLAKFELDHVAEQLGKQKGDYAAITKAMGEDAMRQIAYKVVQQVDDRLGQVAYDNMRWNKMAKQVAQASIQSVGWNVGTANVIFGGARDVQRLFAPEQLLAPLDREGKVHGTLSRVTGRLSYLIALNTTVAMMGMGLQYAMSGEDPKDLRDLFFPRTGRKNPDGTDERISLPSYIKDEWALSQHPIQTIQHKLHPSFSMVAELLNNKDFYGNQIVNPDDPWTKIAGQVAGYLGQSVTPYAITGMQQSLHKGTSPEMAALPFIGVTPAPASVSRTPFESYVIDKYQDAFHTSKTPEGAEKAQARSDAINAIKNGKEPDLTMFSPQERSNIYTSARTPMQTSLFKRLPLEQQLSAYDKATVDEVQKYRLLPILLHSYAIHGSQMDQDARARAQEIITAKQKS